MSLSLSSTTWSSLRGVFGAAEKPSLPPTPKIYGPRDLPLQLAKLGTADAELARILKPKAWPEGQAGKKRKERKAREVRELLPIAPRANQRFYDRNSKMCIRVVRLRNAQVKLRICGSKGSVVARPLYDQAPISPRHQVGPTVTLQPSPEPQAPQQMSSSMSKTPSLRSEPDQRLSGTEEKLLSLAEMRKEMIDNAKEDVRASVFQKLQDHNEVHRDDLPKGLELCGFVGIRQAWVDSVCDSITKYSTLELDEFVAFVRGYESNQDDFYKSTFEEADLDNSGTMEEGELAEMLQSLGIEPMSHVLTELIHEVDEDNKGALMFPEFKHLMDLLMVREGFTSSEYEIYVDLFNRVDAKKTGEISDDDVRMILKWLACSLPEEALVEILKDVDADMSGTINQREYLRCLRKVREHELEVVRLAMLEALDSEGLLPKERLPEIFRDLGYALADEIAILEASEAVERLDLSNLWRLLIKYRQREGMRNEELDSIDAAFHSEGAEHLTLLEVPTAIRSLGYQVGLEAIQSVLRQVDVDAGGRLDKMQFRKAIRMLQESDLEVFQQAFDEADIGKQQAIPTLSAIQAYHTTGLSAQSLELPNFHTAGPLVTRDSFVRACHWHANKVRKSIKRNGGWTDPEVEELKLLFRRYDLDKNQRIKNKELVQLVEDVVPDLAHERAMRPMLLHLMRAVDSESRGLDMQDFLKLMGLFRSFRDKESLRKEQLIIRDTGFLPHEVAEFRALFANFVSDAQEMSYATFWQVINGITSMGKSLSEELELIWKETVQRQEADFADFLLLMKTLLDRDFGQIRERSAKRSARRKS